MNKFFTDIAWEDYLYWQTTDKKVLKKVNELLKDIERNGNEGLGKPEPLRHELNGYWSRRISPEHRLIYKMDDENIYVLQCRGHYE
ncbi:toxin YoeB [Sporomusaceae bacterium BoRhaA]|uniref:Txe/YoeB family addiction module toxin n=1 Tax=Pelorhabdus rhamnosifermentans TaxID=2772457 RepID=UPI001C0605B9|nr:Txe/YoeB family addiction module toxin [Pelorhabdus rhamnosifermentans]MBU2699054.1 toxin YoeB [Pelorhabdus rhamnosifermentans]